MVTSPDFDRQEAADRDFGRVWNDAELFFHSEPGLLVGYLVMLRTLYIAKLVLTEVIADWVNICSAQNIIMVSPQKLDLT